MKRAICNYTIRNLFQLFILAVCIGLSGSDDVLAQSSIKYVYDELGRLIAVTDPAGDTVRYSYDAVGNILSISRQSSSTLSLITFSPSVGPVGTSVTIYGTGFSTTPSQNTVTFNGVTATVSASTATQLTTTVPTGATTGVIGVTTSAGSVSSSTSFTVAAAATPTISSFSPTIGPAGTSVTISGTNFDTTASKNKTKFNITNSLVSSATATSISTSVPTVSGSGKVTVSTSKGTATSGDDFFAPPSPYTASDVAVTGRMTAGNSQTVTLSTSGKVGMILFDATAGQRASIKVTSCSITSVRISIYQPNGSLLGSGTAISTGGFIETTKLSTVGG
ncbi:MAG TPA: IPT/TIG domain-containing protein, partial [Pyrinomonadaceae bacterium]